MKFQNPSIHIFSRRYYGKYHALFNQIMRKSTSKMHNIEVRDFSKKTKSKGKGQAQKRKTRFIKPIDVGAFSPSKEPILQLENGFYLIYYHRQRFFTMSLLYLKILIPLLGLLYLIKKNPFYKSFPAALPIMFVLFIF